MSEYIRHRAKCIHPDCDKTFIKGKRGLFCYKHARERKEAGLAPMRPTRLAIASDEIPGYVRLADTPMPRANPWAQRGDYEP